MILCVSNSTLKMYERSPRQLEPQNDSALTLEDDSGWRTTSHGKRYNGEILTCLERFRVGNLWRQLPG